MLKQILAQAATNAVTPAPPSPLPLPARVPLAACERGLR